MIGRAGLAAVVVVSAVVGGHSIHPRTLYNQMYPVSSLKRHAFNLCQESDPAFIRAFRSDRAACYERMPYSISLALGFVRPTDELAAFFSPLGRAPDDGALLPDAGFGGWIPTVQPVYDPRLADGRAVPCPMTPVLAADSTGALPLDDVTGRRDTIDAAALAALGLSRRERNAAPGPSAENTASSRSGLSLFSTADAADLGHTPAPPAGCSTGI